jgi:AraC family transcriptional regulator, regulatory protein of adaptative response / DNA-3-methyladenine glycosylase II
MKKFGPAWDATGYHVRKRRVGCGSRWHNPPMSLDSDACYRALAAHDSRFDGRFYVGVSTTRIYCRPVCAVRLLRRENCHFFASAAAAEVEGYRPCLRCRPELAPGNASVDSVARLAQGAVDLIENGVLDAGGIEHLSARVGVTSRHLRRIFESEFGVSPIEYAQTQRLLLAKRLLTDTVLPVTEVASASGFASVRRFNALFKARYRMAPGRLREARGRGALPAALAFDLSFRPPYDWESMLSFLRHRAIEGVETVGDDAYARTVAIDHRGTRHVGRVEVREVREVRGVPRRPALRVAVSPSLARAVPAVLSRVKHAFDLACDPALVAATLGPLADAHPGLRVPGTFDGFELAVRAIVGQQISVRAARTVLGRIASAFGEPLAVGQGDASLRLFPTALRIASLAPEDLVRSGVTSARARALIGLAAAVASKHFRLEPESDVESTVAALIALPGIGAWTANYIAMRALRWPDAFLANDLVVLKALGETRPTRALRRSEAWRPWRSYAVIHLWRNAS